VQRGAADRKRLEKLAEGINAMTFNLLMETPSLILSVPWRTVFSQSEYGKTSHPYQEVLLILPAPQAQGPVPRRLSIDARDIAVDR